MPRRNLFLKTKKIPIKVKIILATTAAATPQNKTFCLISEGNDDATIPIIIALSAAKTKSMRII